MGMRRKLRIAERTEYKLANVHPEDVGAGVRRAQVRLGYRTPEGKLTDWLKGQFETARARLAAYKTRYPTPRVR